ncbi:MAG: hypothetical protein F6J86_09915 [Symploca sp. SIO1B1]|nr:hypothetical protein [Symploca sp. SIO1A3]NER94136.1 hypothetical protein [Symploca sp. SIO1B1]
MTIKIMTWNIERMSTRKSDNGAVCNAIAKTIVDEKVDIFILVELMPQDIEVVESLAEAMTDNLPLNSGITYKTYYSPRSVTGTIYTNPGVMTYRERFGFIVNDSTTKAYGFLQALSDPNYYIKINDTNAVPTSPLNASTQQTKQDTIENSFYLLDKGFPCGRPPCLAEFKVGGVQLYVISVHLAPKTKWADIQMSQGILPFEWAQDKNKELVITGDFNFDPANLRAVVTAELTRLTLKSQITAKTHINPSANEKLLDNFFYRQDSLKTRSGTGKVISIDTILDNLYDQGASGGELKVYIATKNTPPSPQQKPIINKFIKQGPVVLNTQEKAYIYRTFISDHFPIVLTIA